MSNVLKSKVLLGGMIVLAAVVGAMFIATTANAYTHSMTLKMGSTGSQVMELQKALNAGSCKVAASGVGSSGMESSYFGGLTKAAVMCYQSANSLTADGIVGPMSGAKLGMVVNNDNDNDNDNNDNDNTSGLGAGQDKEYYENNQGRLIDGKGTKARYVRFSSKGGTANDNNNYIEAEIWGK